MHVENLCYCKKEPSLKKCLSINVNKLSVVCVFTRDIEMAQMEEF